MKIVTPEYRMNTVFDIFQQKTGIRVNKGRNISNMLTVYWSDYFSDNGHRSFLSECHISNEKSLLETAMRCFITFNGEYADCIALSVTAESCHLSEDRFINGLGNKIISVFGDITYGIISDMTNNKAVTVLISVNPVCSRHHYCDVVKYTAEALEAVGISVYPATVVNGSKIPKAFFHIHNV